MKPILNFILVAVLCCSSCQQPAETKSAEAGEIDFEKEKVAIMSVIERESAAFWNKITTNGHTNPI